MAADPTQGSSRPPDPHQFATTHWSVVLAAAHTDSPEARAALEQLCQAYWYPLYAFARREGHDPDQAQDLIQAFFAHLLQKQALKKADPARGRFRSFLLGSLKHFLAHEHQHAEAWKRGGRARHISLDEPGVEETYHQELAHDLNAERLYDRAWACRVLERARRAVREEYAGKGLADRFVWLEKFLPGEENPLTCAEVGRQLGLAEGTVKADIHRLKERYQAHIRRQIAPTVGSPREIDDELQALIAALAV